ncbi:hypothetical protein N0V93_002369 [Gnomoniopsis smithogilvyi]|uniref:EamA domain-containing protein n=1 Tax=Gnomoniopsis smithogilvyi TaxID=1191159 RepID=A0A9W9CYX7_9PEZI|nr:hypothetical protein N0V93_002369 [Gnomoniopsis smithogilvyi]
MAPSHRDESAAAGGEEEVTVEVRKVNVLQSIWENNKGALLILISELFGSSMDAMARYLQQGDSVHYLPLAEATVFRFLIPLVTAWSCHVFLGQVFTSTQLTAALIALVGVVIIAHPSALFGEVSDTIGTTTTTDDLDDVSPAQRLFAIGMSLFGIFGAAGAYTVIRLVGGRAHALFSVNYFAFIAAAGSAVALIAIPGIGFVMPHDAKEWVLLVAMGLFGFALQFLLTTGLQLDKSPKATAMLYVQVIFALGFDFGIWGVIPGGWSLFGGAIVVASTLWSALQKTQPPKEESAKKSVVDEETALLGAQTEGEETRHEQRA